MNADAISIQAQLHNKIASTCALISELHDILPRVDAFGPQSDDGSSTMTENGVGWWPSASDCADKNTNSSSGFEIDANGLSVLERVGEGSRSIVFDGVLHASKRRVAVKRLRAGFAVERKAALVADLEELGRTLRHPSIVDCLGARLDERTRRVEVVFEFMGGGTLEAHYEALNDAASSSKPVAAELAQIVRWSTHMFEGLKFLHERDFPIVLRDLKPRNLLLSSDLAALKILDFGLRKTADIGPFFAAQRARHEEGSGGRGEEDGGDPTACERSSQHTNLTINPAKLLQPSCMLFTDTARCASSPRDCEEIVDGTVTSQDR